MREIASSRTIDRGFTSPQSKVKSRKSRVKNDGPRVQWESRAVRHKAREQNPSGVLAYLAPSGRHRGGSDCFLLSAFCFLLSAFCFLLSAFCFLLSDSGLSPPDYLLHFANFTDPVSNCR
jgi:hypothetical protein